MGEGQGRGELEGIREREGHGVGPFLLLNHYLADCTLDIVKLDAACYIRRFQVARAEAKGSGRRGIDWAGKTCGWRELFGVLGMLRAGRGTCMSGKVGPER